MTRTIEITIPTFHPGQVQAFQTPGRFKALRCGRRWGKTEFGTGIATDGAVKQQLIGWFAPEYKFLNEPYKNIERMLGDFVKSSNENKGEIITSNGGQIDFWSLTNEKAGRGRKYHKVLIDEAAFAKDNSMKDLWRLNIRPTLVDYRGSAIAMSNTNGEDPANWFWQICNDKSLGFIDFHAPSMDNPHLPAEELEELKGNSHPLVWKQEYLAEFVDWSGVAFFSLDKMVQGDGQPWPDPPRCDGVFATIDSATKTGKEHDGTAVMYWALVNTPSPVLYLLDWDIVKIEGSLLEAWLPGVFITLKSYATSCKSAAPPLGAWIEDKSSGMILLQQARRRQWPAHTINSKLTAVGKDERAISVSGYVYTRKVRLTKRAYEKVTTYNSQQANHMRSQVIGYRVGKEMDEDDLLDTFTYGIALSLGDYKGF